MHKIADLTIYRRPEWYSAFPSLTRTATGDLLCGFRRAPREAEGYSHLHSCSRAVFVRSRDDGLTWTSPATTICPRDELGQQDPQLVTLASGRLLASFFRWQAHSLHEELALDGLRLHRAKDCLWSNAGIGCCHSDDDGATWSELRRLAHPWRIRGGASRAPAVELPTGRLLLPGYARRAGSARDVAYLMRSDDQGLTWAFHAVMADGSESDDPYDCHEPFVVRAAAGRLLCFIRCYGDQGRMRWCHSDDDGVTWSPAVESTLWGFPQAALRLRDDRLLLAYGYRRDPLGVRARLLAPDASDLETAPELIIRDDGVDADLGYPTLAERRDGTVLCAYYFHGADGLRHIAGAILDPNH